MIISKNIKIKIYNNNYKYYKSKGYDIKIGDIIDISVNDLPNQSTIKVNVKCDICGKERNIEYRRYINNKKNKNFYVCSLSCAQEKIKITKKERYNDPNFSNIEKRKKTCLIKYNNENYKNVEKRNKTNIEKYGYSSPIKNDNVIKKRINTFKNKYDEEHPMKNENIINKKRNTTFIKYGNINYNNVNKIIETSRLNREKKLNKKYNVNIIDYDVNGDYIIKCEKCGNDFNISNTLLNKRRLYNVGNICTICNPINKKSSDMERKIQEFIENNYDGEIILNDRHLGKELDIYLPELKIAFEFNGLYWHSELYKEKNYHYNKTNLCEENNIQLIYIWEDDWVNKEDVIKSIILNKIGKTPNKIYARKTELREINDSKLIKKFIQENHIQGFIGSKVKLGLFYENELVSLMTFGKKRVVMGQKKSNDDEYELLRFCNKKNTSIVGAASKMFKYFVKNYKPKEIITYADRSYSNGNLYKKLGFNYDSKTDPNYYYIIDGIRKHRFGFRKDVLIKKGFDPNKTEHEIMLERKLYRIFNAGNLKFTYSS